jgi:TolB-like protein
MKLSILFSALLFSITIQLSAKKTVAISYFDNTSGNEQYNALSKGITDMLITDLSKIQEIQIVEREKLESLIAEIKLGQTSYFDQNTAQQMGKGLGADAILTGAFLLLDKTLRIDARLIDVESGEILVAESISGSMSNFFDLHKELVILLGKSLKISSNEVTKTISAYKPVKLATMVSYSEALDNIDQGLEEEAIKELEEISESNPGFLFAQDKLQQVRDNIKVLEQERERLIKEYVDNILLNIDFSTEGWGMAINNAWSSLMSSFRYQAMLNFNEELIKKGVDLNANMFGDAYPIKAGEMLSYYNIMAHHQLKHHDDVINQGQVFMQAYPVSNYFIAIKAYVDQSLTELEARREGAKRNELQTSIETFLEYDKYVNTFYSYHQFLDHRELQYFNELVEKEIIDFLFNLGTYPTDYSLYDLEDVFETAIRLEQETTASNIIQLSRELPHTFDEEETILEMQEEWDKHIETYNKNQQYVTDIFEEFNTVAPEEMYRLIDKSYKILKAGGTGIVENACREYLEFNDPRENDERARTRHKAWESYLVVAEYEGEVKNYEDRLEQYKNDEFLKSHNKEWYSNKLKNYEKDLRDLLSDFRNYEERLVNYPIDATLLSVKANVAGENKQYIAEIKYRNKILKSYSLSNEQKSLQMYSLCMAYISLGYFDKARNVADKMNAELPENSYSSSIQSLLQYLPR